MSFPSTSFGFATEGTEVVSSFPSSVKGKAFLITGPSTGSIGAETVLSLAHGAPHLLILFRRDIAKVQPVIDSIASISPSTIVKFVAVQLDSLASVREAAKTVLEDNDVGSIDVLINNAGVMACPYGKTVDGFETQFGTNHLSHFLLTNLLMPKLLSASPPARIINLSSTAHIVSPVRFDDLGFKNGEEYVPWLAYGQSKTANILFTVELNRLLGDKGIKSFSMHPGSITSGLQKYVTKEMMVQGMTLWKSLGKTPNPTHKTLQQGCSTTLRAALDPEMSPEDGVYLVDCQITNEEADLQPYAVDVENAKKLWSVSEELVGEKFGF